MHGIAIRPRLHIKLMVWNAHGHRLCYLRIHGTPAPISIIFTYQLKSAAILKKRTSTTTYKQNIRRRDLLMIGGDMNASIAPPLESEKKHLEKFGIGSRNNSGERPAVCHAKRSRAINTIIRKRNHILPIWYSNDHRPKN